MSFVVVVIACLIILVPGLFVQPGFTKSIVGLNRRESDLLLKFLFDHIAGGHDFQVRFKWTEDTIAVWDNRATFHCAIFDYFKFGRRHGWRITPTVSYYKLKKYNAIVLIKFYRLKDPITIPTANQESRIWQKELKRQLAHNSLISSAIYQIKISSIKPCFIQIALLVE